VRNDTRLKLASVDGKENCPAHKPLVEILLSFDKRLFRIECLVLVAAGAGLGSLGKDVLVPVLVKLAGG
jgi:hypothetical protein